MLTLKLTVMSESVPVRILLAGATCALVLALYCGAVASEVESLQQGGVTIEYSRYQKFLAERCLATVAKTRSELLQGLGLAAPDTFTIKLFTSADGYNEFIAGRVHPHSLGVAFPYAQLIAINASAQGLATDRDLSATARHEMLHLAIGQLEQQSGQPVPLWFNEGLAVRFSGQNILQEPRILRQAAATGTIYSLSQLTESFPGGQINLSLAYEEAESAVGYLAHRHGGAVFRSLFDRMRAGESFEQAIARVTGGPLADFEAKWRETVKVSFWDWVNLISGISLFTLVALLMVVAYLTMRWRARRKLRQWAEEEGEPYGGEDESPPEADEDDDVR